MRAADLAAPASLSQAALRRGRASALSGLIACILFATTAAPNASVAQPIGVRDAVNQARARCKASGVGEQIARSMDVNGDRRPDWIVDTAALGCAPCGALGCEILVFLSNGVGQFDRAFAGRVTGWRLRPGRRPLFEVSRASPYCPGGGARGCSETYEPRGSALVLTGRSSVTFGRPELRGADPAPEGVAPEAAAPFVETPAPEALPPSRAPAERRRQLQDAPYVR